MIAKWNILWWIGVIMFILECYDRKGSFDFSCIILIWISILGMDVCNLRKEEPNES